MVPFCKSFTIFLLQFAVLLAIIFILEISAGALSYAYKNKVDLAHFTVIAELWFTGQCALLNCPNMLNLLFYCKAWRLCPSGTGKWRPWIQYETRVQEGHGQNTATGNVHTLTLVTPIRIVSSSKSQLYKDENLSWAAHFEYILKPVSSVSSPFSIYSWSNPCLAITVSFGTHTRLMGTEAYYHID